MDGFFLRKLTTEFRKTLLNARVQKIYQTAKEEFVFTLYNERKTYVLIFGINSAAQRVCFSENFDENEFKYGVAANSPFFLKLKKTLSNGKVTDIYQIGLDRILVFRFSAYNEIGDLFEYELISELTGRNSNFILVDTSNNIILEALKKTNPYGNEDNVREVFPKLKYERPPAEKKLLLTENLTRSEISKAFKPFYEQKFSEAFYKVFEGGSPLIGREISEIISKNTDAFVSEIISTEKFYEIADNINRVLNDENHSSYNVIEINGKAKDFSILKILQYGNIAKLREFKSANELIYSFFLEKSENEKIAARYSALYKNIDSLINKARRKIETRNNEYTASENAIIYKTYGDIIMTYIYEGEIKKGDVVFEKDGVRVPLEKSLSPVENANLHYAKYKKLKNSKTVLETLLQTAQDELEYLENTKTALNSTVYSDVSDKTSAVEEIINDLRTEGFLKKSNDKKTKNHKTKPLPFLKFTSTNGFEIICGRTSQQNDNLTFKVADKNDIWLHAQKISGAHVIIKTNGKSVDSKTLYEAAEIAAKYSSAAISADVDYTKIKNVKKIPSAKPGNVIFSDFKTIFVKLKND